MMAATAPASLSNPLSARDLADLNSAIYLLTQVVAKIDQAERAGRDVTDLRQIQSDTLQQAMTLKSVYFPESQ
jgi:hypothetical protein